MNTPVSIGQLRRDVSELINAAIVRNRLMTAVGIEIGTIPRGTMKIWATVAESLRQDWSPEEIS